MAIYCKNDQCEACTMDRSEGDNWLCDDCWEKSVLILETMSDDEFNRFLRTTPPRVQMLVRSKMCDWKQVLPQWYIKFQNEFIGAKRFHSA